MEPGLELPDNEELPWPDRSAGVLLHPTSLPGPFGVGDLGPEAHRFVDMLVSGGQRVWQVMPLGPPGPSDSPYAARSSFAGNPLLISPEAMAADGLLDEGDLRDVPALSNQRVDFPEVAQLKESLFRRAFGRFDHGRFRDWEEFVDRSRAWLPDFALFMAIRARNSRSWWEWPEELAGRDAGAVERASRELGDEIRFQEFLQWLFWRQWGALRARANGSGIRIFGDIPIFVDLDSADVWANQRLFRLGHGGQPEVVTGVPPDAFSATGQHWGNPHYRWDVLRDEGYTWWIERLRHTLTMADLVRIDHFRGFEAAWEIPAGAPTAVHGHWAPGPGEEFFQHAEQALGKLPIVVEDLGVITKKVRALRDTLGFPGMKVLQFAFGDDARNPYLPHNLTANCVVYTGTHDNDTTIGWFATRSHDERDRIRRYLATDGHDIASDLIRTAYASVAEMAIVPMQDVLRLGPEARMNVPGDAHGNWHWRFRNEQVDPGRIVWLREMATTYGRLPG